MQHADAWNFAEKHLSPYAHLMDYKKSKSDMRKAARERLYERKRDKAKESWLETNLRLHPEWDDDIEI
jgi:hypothetical protein